MEWKDSGRDSVGTKWGHAPSLVEGVPAKLRLPAGRAWKAFALDERGQRREEAPIQDGTLGDWAEIQDALVRRYVGLTLRALWESFEIPVYGIAKCRK